MPILDLIEFEDHNGDILVTRVPADKNSEIRLGSQLVVHQSQVAIFCVDGQFLDKFGPGRHTLKTSNIPLLGSLIKLPFDESPFKASVYFVGKQTFSNLGWGTQTPVVLRDSELRMVSLRAYGMFSLRIVDEMLFLTNLVGSRGLHTTYALETFFRSMIISRVVDVLGNTLDTILHLARHYREIAENVRASTREEMSNYGIELVDLVVEAITPPPEVQEMINKAGGIAAQDLMAYSQISKADALVAAAGNPGGAAGEGVGTGVGIAMGLGAARELLGSNPVSGVADGKGATVGGDSNTMSPEQALDKLRKIKIMLDEGLITQEQYEIERQEVLDIL